VRLLGDLHSLRFQFANRFRDVIADQHEMRREAKLGAEAVGQFALAVHGHVAEDDLPAGARRTGCDPPEAAAFAVVAVDLEAESVSVPVGGGPWVGDVVREGGVGVMLITASSAACPATASADCRPAGRAPSTIKKRTRPLPANPH
jgi:hypothetical protein